MDTPAEPVTHERTATKPRIYRPAIYVLPDELHYMRVLDVMRMLNPDKPTSVAKVLTILTSFQALAPLCIERERTHEPDLRITNEEARRIFTLAEFNENMDDAVIEGLFINIRWASRIILANERKGARAEVELHPMFGLFGPRRRMARVYLVGENSSFLM